MTNTLTHARKDAAEFLQSLTEVWVALVRPCRKRMPEVPYLMLTLLSREEMTGAELTQVLGISPQQCQLTRQRLMHYGWMTRRNECVDMDAGRHSTWYYGLTEAGREALAEHLRYLSVRVTPALARLEERERRCLMVALTKLYLNAEGAECRHSEVSSQE